MTIPWEAATTCIMLRGPGRVAECREVGPRPIPVSQTPYAFRATSRVTLPGFPPRQPEPRWRMGISPGFSQRAGGYSMGAHGAHLSRPNPPPHGRVPAGARLAGAGATGGWFLASLSWPSSGLLGNVGGMPGLTSTRWGGRCRGARPRLAPEGVAGGR